MHFPLPFYLGCGLLCSLPICPWSIDVITQNPFRGNNDHIIVLIDFIVLFDGNSMAQVSLESSWTYQWTRERPETSLDSSLFSASLPPSQHYGSVTATFPVGFGWHGDVHFSLFRVLFIFFIFLFYFVFIAIPPSSADCHCVYPSCAGRKGGGEAVKTCLWPLRQVSSPECQVIKGQRHATGRSVQ
jgi:hypothetical protein